jgi:hypothetical protein
MSASAILVAAVESAPATQDGVLADRMAAARIGAVIAFAMLLGGLIYWARRLARQTRQIEQEQRLESAFREIDETLAQQAPPGRARNEKDA